MSDTPAPEIDAISELFRKAKAEAWNEAQSGMYIDGDDIAVRANPYEHREYPDVCEAVVCDEPAVCEVAEPLDHDMYTYRRPALDLALGFNQGSSLHDPRSVVADAAAFEDYLRNGAGK